MIVTLPFEGWSPAGIYHGNDGRLERRDGVITVGGGVRGVHTLAPWGQSPKTELGLTRVTGGISVTQTGLAGSTPDKIQADGYVISGDATDLWQNKVDVGLGELGTAAKVSKFGSYGGGSYVARPWSLASYGDIVVATNWADPIQQMTPSDPAGNFADLVTSTDKPQAEFVAPLGSSILIGNILTTASTALGAAGAYPNYIWLSGLELIDQFGTGISGSSFQPLVSLPGRITGMAGGERFAHVFKPAGVYLISLTGDAGAFSVDILSPSIGTIWGKSVVSWSDETFFWGTSGGIYRISGNGGPQHISGPIDHFLTGSEEYSANWHGSSPAGTPTTLPPETRVWGFVETKTGSIGWLYQGIGSHPGSNPLERRWSFIFYSPQTDEWSFVSPVRNQFADSDTEMVPHAAISLGHGMLDPSIGASFNLQAAVYSYGLPDGAAKRQSRIEGSSTPPWISYAVNQSPPRHKAIYQSKIFVPSLLQENGRETLATMKRICPLFYGFGTRPSVSLEVAYGSLPDLSDSTSVTVDESYRVDGSRWYQVPSDANGVYFRITATLGGDDSLDYDLQSFFALQMDIHIGGDK